MTRYNIHISNVKLKSVDETWKKQNGTQECEKQKNYPVKPTIADFVVTFFDSNTLISERDGLNFPAIELPSTAALFLLLLMCFSCSYYSESCKNITPIPLDLEMAKLR